MFYIYILYSKSSDKFYVGYTNNPAKRLEEHNRSPKNTYTSKHRPWELKALFACNGNEADVMKIERFIKKQKTRKFIQALINGDTPLTGDLAQLVNPANAGRTCGINQRVSGSSPEGGA